MTAAAYSLDATEFGFHIPTGDPGAISEGAANWAYLSETLTRQRSFLARAVRETTGSQNWSGPAASHFAASARVLLTTIAGNAAASEQVGQLLTSLAGELTTAQALTRKALSECEDAQTESRHQREIADQESEEAERQNRYALESIHDQGKMRQHEEAADGAQRACVRATDAAADADQRLSIAKQRGQAALEDYHGAASKIVAALQLATADLKPAAEQARGVANAIGTNLPPILAKSKTHKVERHTVRPLTAQQAAWAATYFKSCDRALRDLDVPPAAAKATATALADKAARHEQFAQQLITVILPALESAASGRSQAASTKAAEHHAS